VAAFGCALRSARSPLKGVTGTFYPRCGLARLKQSSPRFGRKGARPKAHARGRVWMKCPALPLVLAVQARAKTQRMARRRPALAKRRGRRAIGAAPRHRVWTDGSTLAGWVTMRSAWMHRCDLRRSLARDDAGDDPFSTVNGQAGILMRVGRPSGSAAGAPRLQPNPVSDGQPDQTSRLAPRSRPARQPSAACRARAWRRRQTTRALCALSLPRDAAQIDRFRHRDLPSATA